MKLTITLSLICLAPVFAGPEPTPVPSITDRLKDLTENVEASHQISVLAYPGYAPDLKVNGTSKPWGMGVALLYPVGDYAFTGARLDFMGNNWFAPSVNVGLKADIQLFGYKVTPFTMAGAVMPLSGAGSQNTVVGAIVGGGFNALVWQSKDGRASLNIFAAVEKWTQYDGQIYRPGAAFTVKW